MEFHDYQTYYQVTKKAAPELLSGLKPEPWYDMIFASETALEKFKAAHSIGRLSTESSWYLSGRPFYNVWPVVAEGLAKTRLDIPVETLVPLFRTLPFSFVIRFPVGKELDAGSYKIRSIICGRISLVEREGYKGESKGLHIACDAGDLDEEGIIIYWNRTFGLEEGTVEDELARCHDKVELTKEENSTIKVAIRVAIGIALLHGDSELVEGLVMKKDEVKFRETGDLNLVEKAKRRGLFGFNVGAHVEVHPHYRCPHFSIRWTGKGRTIPQLRPIKGCIVHRKLLTEVPTDYLGTETQENTSENQETRTS